MEEQIYPLWAKAYDMVWADPRDFKVEEVLPVPTAEQLANLPSVVDRANNIGYTLNQGYLWSCTSLWTTHCMQIQNITELATIDKSENILDKINSTTNLIMNNDSWKDLWTKMWHDINKPSDSWDYVEHAISVIRQFWEKGKDIYWSDFEYKVDWFAYIHLDSSDECLQNLKFQLTQAPLVFIMQGGNVLRNEMSKWEVKTPMTTWYNWGHCICMRWYNDTTRKLKFLNSWTPNNWSLCEFEMDYDVFKEMVDNHQINWRCWRLFDKKDAVVNIDIHINKQNVIQMLKFAKLIYAKWTPADIEFFNKIQLSNFFMKEYGILATDLQ